jgi:hypothetical protein
MKMNKLAKIDERQVSPWRTYADQTLASAIAGDLLLYRKGKRTRGEDDRPVPLGTRLLANMIEVWTGHVRWWDNSPVEYRIARLIDFPPEVVREDLGHMDKSLWETDQQGNPRDPWQPVDRIVMRDMDGELLTFSTSSWGGRKAVAKLCRDFDQNYQKHPGAWPIVELRSKDRRSADFGLIPEPVFTIVDWAPWDEETMPDAKALETPKAPDAATELDDQIPFFDED